MREDGVQTRAKIRDAAHTEFAAHGLAGARVDRIAKAAGANVQRIYAYHSDKAGLFRACVLDAVADLDRAVGDPTDVVTLAGRLFDHVGRDGHTLRILTWARLEMAEDLREIIAASGADPLRHVRALADAGRLHPRWAPEDVLAVLIGFCEAWNTISARPPTTEAAAARRRELVLHLATQLMPDAAPAGRA
ncbi:TetR/AcrR family transcriptional regulator [Cellulomonas sp. 179-A 4D5 NHS]|uniref:TetR/AcrR family transcriptional regulator n=1 Tax=Cellulomonas sp. 179-A 4D5 NHS TaxID=3142378 RepID=UPI00399F85A7